MPQSRKKVNKMKIDPSMLVDKGLELMFLRGYNDVSIKDLVDAAGMPKGSFYNHYKSKEDFGLAVLDRYSEIWNEVLRSYLGDSSIPARLRLERFIDHSIDASMEWNYTRGCLAGNFSQEMGDVSEIFAHRVDAVLKTAEAYFVNIVREAQLAGDLSPHLDPEDTGAFLLNAYEGALMRMKSARSASPLTGFKDMVFGVIFHASAVKTQQRAA